MGGGSDWQALLIPRRYHVKEATAFTGHLPGVSLEGGVCACAHAGGGGGGMNLLILHHFSHLVPFLLRPLVFLL